MVNPNVDSNESSRFIYASIKFTIIPAYPWPCFYHVLNVITINNHLPNLNKDTQGDDSSMTATLNCDNPQTQPLSHLAAYGHG